MIPMNGKANPTRRSMRTPISSTSESDMKNRIKYGRNGMTSAAAATRMSVEISMPSQATRRARSGLEAPRFCPTMVAVA